MDPSLARMVSLPWPMSTLVTWPSTIAGAPALLQSAGLSCARATPPDSTRPPTTATVKSILFLIAVSSLGYVVNGACRSANARADQGAFFRAITRARSDRGPSPRPHSRARHGAAGGGKYSENQHTGDCNCLRGLHGYTSLTYFT